MVRGIERVVDVKGRWGDEEEAGCVLRHGGFGGRRGDKGWRRVVEADGGTGLGEGWGERGFREERGGGGGGVVD